MQQKTNNTDAGMLRSEMKERRKELGDSYRREASLKIVEQIMGFLDRCGGDFQAVLGFASFGTEADLWPLYDRFWDNGKPVFLPVTGKDHVISFYEVRAKEELTQGTWNILEPTDQSEERLLERAVDSKGRMLVLVPGLAFDRKGHRVGYGGGYYDRFLAKYPNALKAAVAFDAQIVSGIDPKPWDISVDRIITENEIIYTDR